MSKLFLAFSVGVLSGSIVWFGLNALNDRDLISTIRKNRIVSMRIAGTKIMCTEVRK